MLCGLGYFSQNGIYDLVCSDKHSERRMTLPVYDLSLYINYSPYAGTAMQKEKKCSPIIRKGNIIAWVDSLDRFFLFEL